MNPFADIRSPLIVLLAANVGTIPIAGENLGATPPVNAPWIATFFDLNDTIVDTLGDDGDNATTGIFQIDLNWPMMTGDSEQGLLIAQLYSVFRIGSTILQNGVTTRIVSFRTTAGRKVDEYWRISVTVTWSASSKRNV